MKKHKLTLIQTDILEKDWINMVTSVVKGLRILVLAMNLNPTVTMEITAVIKREQLIIVILIIKIMQKLSEEIAHLLKELSEDLREVEDSIKMDLTAAEFIGKDISHYAKI